MHLLSLFRLSLVGLFVATCWLPLGLHAAPFNELSGPLFSDHAHREVVDTQWEQSPLNRSEWGEVDLALTLDQHLYPALLPFIQDYAADHKLRIAVQEGTCGISAGKLLDRTVDVGGFCCPPGETDRLPGLRYHTLGIAALALFAHPDVPVDDMSFAQAQTVFNGDLGQWGELDQAGDVSLLLRPIARLHCKARPGHWRLLLDNEELFSPRMSEVSTIPDMLSGVARLPGAIGYETLWMQRLHASRVKVLTIDGVNPADNAALAAGRYPLFRTYHITTWEAEPAADSRAQALVDWLKRVFPQVDSQYGFVDAERLRAAGWRFEEAELVAMPE